MKHLLLFSAVLFALISCDNEHTTPANSVVNLMNLKVGNYWVYDWSEIDAVTGNMTDLNRRDSITIEKDTVINGRTYLIKSGNFFGNTLITKSIIFDSVNSVYSFPDREVMLTLNQSMTITKNFGIENNPIAIGYYSIDNTKVFIEVPAGNFQSINFRGRIEPQQPNYPYGIRYNDNYYSNNIGLVKVRTQVYSSPNDIEMKLIRYGSLN